MLKSAETKAFFVIVYMSIWNPYYFFAHLALCELHMLLDVMPECAIYILSNLVFSSQPM